jgi:hypothetical protein
MILTPNTLGVLLLFLAIFLGCILWATHGRSKPMTIDKIEGVPRPLLARKELSEFLVTATAGAFLLGLAATAPVDLGVWLDPAFKPPGGRQAGFVLLLKYGYAFWLMVYFFLSTFSIKHAKLEEKTAWGIFIILFDLLQSSAALATIFFLGFVNPLAAHDSRHGFIVANGAIFLITLSSWLIFASSTHGVWKKVFLLRGSRINILRWSGMILSALAFCFAWGRYSSEEGSASFLVLWATFLGLLAVLGRYGWMVCRYRLKFIVDYPSWWPDHQEKES